MVGTLVSKLPFCTKNEIFYTNNHTQSFDFKKSLQNKTMPLHDIFDCFINLLSNSARDKKYKKIMKSVTSQPKTRPNLEFCFKTARPGTLIHKV